MTSTNPFFTKFSTPFGAAPFNDIKTEHYLPALDFAIAEAKKGIELIKSVSSPTFSNVVEALDYNDVYLNQVAEVFYNLHSAESNDQLQAIAKEFSPKLTAYSNDVSMDSVLFSKLKAVHESKDSLGLNNEQKQLLEKTYKGFVRNGALLDESQKDILRKIDNELSTLSLQFSDHVLKENKNYLFVVENISELEGLPEGAIEAAAHTAEEKGHKGKWAFTLDIPSYLPIVTYAKNRSLREKLVKDRSALAVHGENSNLEIIKSIVTLKNKRANLLGYKDHAHFVLEERMAKSPSTVLKFLNELVDKSLPKAKFEINELKEYAKKIDGITDLQGWDSAYYFEKLKMEKYNIDDEALRPYLKLENCISGMYKVAELLYGLTFKPVDNIQKYHPDVQTYEVLDRDGKHISLFYADYFPRAGKRAGAWMTSYRGQSRVNGENIRPHISIVCNFTKPTPTKPSLITFDELTTLFHEFGHALHGMLADTTYPSLSGTSVFWDFVELPSQVMENWCYEKECLDLFATHYQTGEKIPADLIQNLKASSNFHEARATIRQLTFGLLDMSFYSTDPSTITNVIEFEDKATSKLTLLPKANPNGSMSCSFSHIFAGGYSAGYYSYKWAEVLDADAFSLFQEKGIFNKDVAESFRKNILSKGGTEHPMELYKKFRGHEPSVDPLLKRAGLI